ncbi:cytochrome o ubiquinol oxidase subunit IV [Buchnera aphidicola (Muscaphis stroyani)]|uniref:Cytochrome bo(3) ubiquinol oxidase subunit 4 n=1 Tax=Buchnera aphidicola (Muscaphis stroyani) TaxID=1241869 RepID=A0A4D6Y538_9GAMM|nr:cytochrome o ubiquinol oxidase subunit IV [Buchnera aphidicola]QCI24507.1 cytochrome o ubiquinol oxidase subunit IV [Buchnera aphidicola (Muscaphis stroyani)]
MNNFFPLLKNCHREIKYYIFGFLFSAVFTAISFLSVINELFSKKITYIVILSSCLIQIVIHFLCFLDLNPSKKNQWNIVSLLFTLIILFIVLFGSIWIMWNLNHHTIIF